MAVVLSDALGPYVAFIPKCECPAYPSELPKSIVPLRGLLAFDNSDGHTKRCAEP